MSSTQIPKSKKGNIIMSEGFVCFAIFSMIQFLILYLSYFFSYTISIIVSLVIFFRIAYMF